MNHRFLIPVLVALALGACRGGTSTSPPVHLVLDMDFQPKIKAQSHSHFAGFADHRGMRLPVMDANGKVAVVPHRAADKPEFPHRQPDGSFVKGNPIAATEAVLAEGRKQFDIHCAICHGYSGRGGSGPSGHGLVARRMQVVVPNFHAVEGKDNRVANLSDAEIVDTISYGKGVNMPAYGARITPESRWAIVHYIRALQNLGRQ